MWEILSSQLLSSNWVRGEGGAALVQDLSFVVHILQSKKKLTQSKKKASLEEDSITEPRCHTGQKKASRFFLFKPCHSKGGNTL